MTHYRFIAAAAVVLLCASPLAPAQDSQPPFGAASARYLDYFDSQGPRPANAPGEKRAAAYITAELQSMGYTPERQAFTETVSQKRTRLRVDSENVVCMKRGASDKEILVVAHYDSVIDGNGTDDNASGVALLLEMCGMVRARTLPHSVRFIFFGAEELGEVGSMHYVKEMDRAARDRTLVVLNYDSLIAGDQLYAHGNYGSRGVVRDWFLQRAGVMGIPLVAQGGKNSRYPEGTTGDWGDQAPFERAGLQYAAFEATNWDLGERDGYTQTDAAWGEKGAIWHTRYDNLQYIERTFPGRSREHLTACSRLLYSFLTEYN